MGKFITTLKAEQISESDGNKNAVWRLTEPLIFESRKLGLIIIDRGTNTDFSSVPRLPISYWLAGGRSNAPAALHDHLYGQNHDTGRCKKITRLQADNLIFEAILDSLPADGYSVKSIMSRQGAYLLASVTWLSVRVFGWMFWH